MLFRTYTFFVKIEAVDESLTGVNKLRNKMCSFDGRTYTPLVQIVHDVVKSSSHTNAGNVDLLNFEESALPNEGASGDSSDVQFIQHFVGKLAESVSTVRDMADSLSVDQTSQGEGTVDTS